jgi:flagellar hook protein FlgE
MSFNVALSGLNAASKDLEATGNNIANASTVGFKKSRVEFGDLYSGGFLSTGAGDTGGGVRVQDVRQLHAQGNLAATNSGLDMAINGEGFFVLNNGGEVRYTRAGQFGLSQNGYLQNNQGMRVQGYQADTDGNVSGILGDLQIETGNLPPQVTTTVNADFNLDSREVAPDPAVNPFSPTNEDSFNYESSTRIYDSLGNPHSLTQYFVKNPTDPADPATFNSWSLYVQADNTMLNPQDAGGDPIPYGLKFNDNGSFDEAASDPVNIVGWTPRDALGNANGAATSDFSIDLSRSSQFGEDNGVNDLRQDGYTTGRLTGLDVSNDGNILGRYSNGRTAVLGQVALANFRNAGGLAPVGETTWVESVESGDAVIGEPGTGPLGNIKASSVEESNVDLSQQLVSLIIAQRNFQANAKTIETSDAITQTIINIR